MVRREAPAGGVGAEVSKLGRSSSCTTALARGAPPKPVQVSTVSSKRSEGVGSSDSSSVDSSPGESESEGEGESKPKRGSKATRKAPAAAPAAAAAAAAAATAATAADSRGEAHKNSASVTATPTSKFAPVERKGNRRDGVGGKKNKGAPDAWTDVAAADWTAVAPIAGQAGAEIAQQQCSTEKEEGGNATGGEGAAEATTTSGSSWAAKMMFSLAHLPTNASVSSFSTRTKPASAMPATTKKGKEGNTPSASAMDDSDAEEDDRAEDDEAGAKPDDTEAVASYPPPPSWLEGNVPVYHAVETPLPSVSGDTGGRGGGKGSVGGSGKSLPRPERWVPVVRPVELQAARMQLPVCGMEQEIMEAIHDNDAVILCGETGSGKSTQVPQFLYEAGYAAHGLIGVTQPRRVAAVGTAERVAVELGTKCGRGGAVAYQIRYDASGVGEKTRVKFMTDGVLLQEITSDLLLRKYSVVLLDEAHERNLNTDVLLGMLSRSIPLR